MTWMVNNASLQKAAHIINELDSSKFPLLLNRITQAMQQAERQTKPFSAPEIEKLQTSLMLEEQDLKLLLDSITLIFEKAGCHMAKPQVLRQQLIDLLGLDQDKAEALASSWASAARAIIGQLRHKSVLPTTLEDIHWNFNLLTASSMTGRVKIPRAVFQFQLKSACGGPACNEELNVEFDHEELYQFYNQLEKIQAQLDSLR